MVAGVINLLLIGLAGFESKFNSSTAHFLVVFSVAILLILLFSGGRWITNRIGRGLTHQK
jgi:hypothetical protein